MAFEPQYISNTVAPFDNLKATGEKINANFEALVNAMGLIVVGVGALSARPAAGNEGATYLTTDEPVTLWFDNGTSWVSALPFGTTTGTACEGDDERLSDARPPDPHALVDNTGHTVSGLTTGHVLTAVTATTVGFASPGALSIPDAAVDTKGITQLSGDLGGSATAPTVVGIHSGATALAISTIVDGEYLKRVGTDIVSAAASGTNNVVLCSFTQATSSPAFF